jgi:DNA-binding MarR family transcriptional regulator
MADLKLLYRRLVGFEIELWNGIEAALQAECDLQLTWFEIMHLLALRGGCRVQDVAEEFAITVGGVSKVVDRIQAAGYCARRANPDDRRSSIIELTPAGRQLLVHATEVFENELELRLGAAAPEQDLERLTETLATLLTAGRALEATRQAEHKPGPQHTPKESHQPAQATGSVPTS